MDNTVDTLRIEVIGETSDAVGGLEKLISVLEKIDKVAGGGSKGLSSVQKKLGKITEAVNSLDAGGIVKIRNLSDSLKKLDGIKISSTIAPRLLDIAAAVERFGSVDMTKIADLAGSLWDMSGRKSIPVPNTPSVADTVTPLAQVRDMTDEIVSATESTQNLNQALSEVDTRLSSVGARTERVAKTAKKSTDKVSARVYSSIRKVTARYTKLLSLLGRRAVYRALNAVISAITSSFRDGVNAVYQYSKALDGRLSKSLDAIATDFNYIKGSLGAMSAPLLNMLAPALDRLTDKFVDLLNIANQVFSRLSGDNTWLKATKVATEYADATKVATAANTALKKTMLGFDEINALSDNSSGGSGTASDTGKFSFTEVPLNTAYADDIVGRLKDVLWYVGAIGLGIQAWNFGSAVTDLLKIGGIESIAFAGGLTLAVAGLTIMVKGITDIIANGINWQNFAETMGGGGGIIAGGALIGAAFGNAALGAAVGAIVAGIPMYIVGIWDAIKNGLNFLNAALIGAGTTLTGAGIGAIIGMVGGPIGAGIGALIGLAVGALTDLGILIAQNWDSIVAWCGQAFSDIGQFFVGIWNRVCEIWSPASEWFDTHVIQPIVTLFKGMWNGIVTFFSSVVDWFSELFGSVYQTISDVFYNIGVIAGGCWAVIKKVWGIVGGWFNENVIQPVSKFFGGLWNGLVNGAKKAWQGVKKVFGTVAAFFRETFEKAWKGIVDVFSVAGEIFNDIKDGVVAAFKTVVNGLIKGINKVVAVPFKGINTALEKLRNVKILDLQPFSGLKTINIPEIPLLASSGMVNAGTAFIAGEAGAEAVAQIGHRTGVMNTDEMRESVALGISDANAEQNALLREQNRILRELLERDDNSGGGAYGSLIGGIARKNRRDGKTVIPLGV